MPEESAPYRSELPGLDEQSVGRIFATNKSSHDISPPAGPASSVDGLFAQCPEILPAVEGFWAPEGLAMARTGFLFFAAPRSLANRGRFLCARWAGPGPDGFVFRSAQEGAR